MRAAHDTRTLSTLADEVLAEIEHVDRVKVAERNALRDAPRHATELGVLAHKLAGELRAPAPEITYDDLADFVGGRL